jgi:Protein of unknown function (DUF2752)
VGYAKRVKRPLRLALLTAAIGLVGFAMSQGFPLCPMAGSLGIPCPGCGLTRATLALLHGDVRAALRFHPLVWLLTPLFVSFVGSAVWQLLRDPAAPRPASRVRWNTPALNVAAVLLLVLTLSVWLARFAGYFGGPAPVTTLYGWVSSRR